MPTLHGETVCMSTADEIWNRAAMERGGPAAKPGDLALASLLQVHNLAMSGGLLDAVERLDSSDLDTAEGAYRWFGLEAAADVVTRVRSEVADGALDDDDRADALEADADAKYGELIPMDQTIVEAFEAKLSREPSAFAAV